MLTISTRPTKLLLNAATFNGLLIIADFPYKEGAAAPISDSAAGTLEVALKKGGFYSIGGTAAFATASAVYPQRGFVYSLPADLRAAEFKELDDIIVQLKPKVILGLGPLAMNFLKKGATSLDDERGAPFHYRQSVCLLSYHPREVYKIYSNNIIFMLDVEKAIRYLKCGWQEPTFHIDYTPEFKDVILFLKKTIEEKPLLAADIETDSNLGMTCVGFSNGTSAITKAFVIPFVKNNKGERWWSFEQELQIWPLLAQALERCPLVGQNAVHFDHFALATKSKILPNFIHDTMLMQWEISCEHQKSLGFISSLYDDVQFWKSTLQEVRKGKLPYTEEFRYNGKDCCSTFRCYKSLTAELKEKGSGPQRHYKTNILLSRAFQYMAIHGMRFDRLKANRRIEELEATVYAQEARLHSIVGFPLNVGSSKQMTDFLYKKLGLRVRYKITRDKLTGEDKESETADFLTLLKIAQENPDRPELLLAGRLRKLKKRLSTLRSIRCRKDGYVSYMLNVVGSMTGRASSRKPLNGEGIQAQNQDRRDRDLYLPDEGFVIAKADLEGADSWSVAAMCKHVGDWQMMEDLEHGLKPAQALTIAHLFGTHLITSPAEELVAFKGQLKEKLSEQKKSRGPGRTDYDVFKAVSHGSNYCMGAATTQDNMFKKSEGELWVPLHEVTAFQNLYFKRYRGLKSVHARIVQLMQHSPSLESEDGHVREFFGRKDNSTVREMMAHLPQANTAFATNQLILRIFYNKRNRTIKNNLLVQPLNQVHDESVIQFPADRIEESVALLKDFSQNTIRLWGSEFSIPFEAAYGPDWGNCNNTIEI